MDTLIVVNDAVSDESAPRGRMPLRPVDRWWAAIAAALIPVSLVWDFSWESTIGVDRFWSPPHLATHLGVWLCGLLGARLIFSATRARDDANGGIHLAGWRGPAGAWILTWGAVTLLAAFLLDNWWQQTYGLGAGLWHPAQILKATGFFALLFGAAVLAAEARAGGRLAWHGGLFLLMCTVVLTTENYPNWQHAAFFHLVSAAIYPAALLMTGGALGRWGTTRVALVYTAIAWVLVWLLPLFPARPLTPPVHNPTDHMMPPPFPLLLVAPAIAMDCLRMRFRFARREGLLAILLGIVFVGVFTCVQWNFAKFLLSPAADNRFFAGGGRHWPFFLKIDQARVMFWDLKQDPLTATSLALATLLAGASAWLGLRAAAWLGKARG